MSKTYEAIVIGAGPGGYPAGIRLGQLGVKTLVVEKEYLGGVCLNWGCIPSKALIAAANTMESIKTANEMGISVGEVKVDVGKMQDWKESIVKTLTGTGQALSMNGKLRDLPVVNEMASLLALPSLRSMPYRDLGLHFSIENGRLGIRDFDVHAQDADIGGGGSIGLDGGLDLAFGVKLSPDATRRALAARGAGAFSSLFTDPQGRLVFDIKVTGTHRAPKLALDWNKTQARSGLTSLTDATAKKLLGGLVRPASGDTSAASEVGRRLIDDATKRLGGKLGGLFGKAPAKRDSTHKP